MQAVVPLGTWLRGDGSYGAAKLKFLHGPNAISSFWRNEGQGSS